ncbi:conserved exported hypothetical protein [uncultured Paludibacter sp.]|nr:conserved exported hypothetical protein [uncultured Paludibacter sp.]
MKKLAQTLTVAGVILFSATLFSGCGSSYYSTSEPYYSYSYNNPAWAPDYYRGVRYYYFPDIECYYDLSSRYFVFLNNGQWIFVETISPFYPAFNLSDSYIVLVNVNVYQPWMHHQYYNSHYPRYYYRDYYDYSNIPYVRGFNENVNSAIYWSESQRDRARNWDDRNLRQNRKFTYSESDRRVQEETTRRVNQERGTVTGSRNNTTTPTRTQTTTTTERTTRETNVNSSLPTRTTTTTRSESNTSTSRESNSNVERRSNTNYYGKPIGRPVKVEPQMRSTTTTNTSRTTNTSTSGRTSTDNSSSSRTSTTGGRR